jgi:hypothetical protein
VGWKIRATRKHTYHLLSKQGHHRPIRTSDFVSKHSTEIIQDFVRHTTTPSHTNVIPGSPFSSSDPISITAVQRSPFASDFPEDHPAPFSTNVPSVCLTPARVSVTAFRVCVCPARVCVTTVRVFVCSTRVFACPTRVSSILANLFSRSCNRSSVEGPFCSTFSNILSIECVLVCPSPKVRLWCPQLSHTYSVSTPKSERCGQGRWYFNRGLEPGFHSPEHSTQTQHGGDTATLQLIHAGFFPSSSSREMSLRTQSTVY